MDTLNVWQALAVYVALNESKFLVYRDIMKGLGYGLVRSISEYNYQRRCLGYETPYGGYVHICEAQYREMRDWRR